tara:strand:+ start:288 stop:1016 length:729 start_codon:yes stop_codon:yes gene_type:complete
MIYYDREAVEISIPKTGTVSRFAMISSKFENINSDNDSYKNLVAIHPLADGKCSIEHQIRKKIAVNSNHGRLNEKNEKNYKFDEHGHFTVRDYNKFLLKRPECKNFFKFSFIRNPYDRFLSTWHWRHNLDECLECGRSMTADTLRVFFGYKQCCKNYYVNFWGSQTEFLVDESGQIKLDFIGRLENFESDYEKMRLMHDKFPKLKKQLHLNSSSRDVVEFATFKEEIYELYKDDFKNLGYKK